MFNQHETTPVPSTKKPFWKRTGNSLGLLVILGLATSFYFSSRVTLGQLQGVSGSNLKYCESFAKTSGTVKQLDLPKEIGGGINFDPAVDYDYRVGDHNLHQYVLEDNSGVDRFGDLEMWRRRFHLGTVQLIASIPVDYDPAKVAAPKVGEFIDVAGIVKCNGLSGKPIAPQAPSDADTAVIRVRLFEVTRESRSSR